MIVKRIIYKIKEGQQDSFYESQKQWAFLSTIEGFISQVGGWDHKNPLTAYIYSFWKNQAYYDYFMEKIHDDIFTYSDPDDIYVSIKVYLFHEKLSIPGIENRIDEILRKGDYIRVALAHVKENKIPHFIDMQEKVWNIGMKKAEGMLGGTFLCSETEITHFLVLTDWRDEKDHNNYMEKYFPTFLKTTQPQNAVLKLAGEQFKVEEAWRVHKKK